MFKNTLISFSFFMGAATLFAQSSSEKNFVLSGSEGWIPNHGQVYNSEFRPNTEVTHLWASGRGLNVQLHCHGISYDTYAPSESGIQFHRLDMRLVGASPESRVTEEEAFGSQFNFYGATSSKGVSVAQFKRVILEDVYPGVDLKCAVQEGDNRGVKYDFIVRSDADLDMVRMEYEGFDFAEVTGDEIHFELSGRSLVESIPESWVTPGRRNATVRYRVIEQSPSKLVVGLEWINAVPLSGDQTLVVDPVPVLHWGTYYGDTLPDAGLAVVTDTVGRVYMAGHTQSLLNIATEGAHQQTYAGGNSDAFLTMFNAHGERLWCTYFGGTGDDQATGVAVDGHYDIYIVGNTTTVDDSLATDSAYQQINAGGTDVFAAKFNNFGALTWSTFLGGFGNDTATACVVDTSGHVFISGYTETGEWLESPEFTYAGGIDAFLVKLDEEGMPVWGTYYGGPEDDYGRDLAVDSLDYLFLTGSTFSEEGIATDTTHQTVNAGEEDAFAVCFNPDGSRKWGTYFGGSEKDVARGIAVYYDAVYVTGYTLSPEGVADSLSFQPDYMGQEEAFLLRLDANGQRLWSTYFGDSLLEKSNAIATDIEGFVYIAGITNTENHALSTNDVHQDWLRGEQEGFIAKFDSLGNRVWSTYYGGFQNDDIMGINVFGVTAIYITGYTWSSEFVAYYGHDIEYGGNTDGFLSRLDMERPTGASGICFGGGGGGGSGGGGSSGTGSTEVINEFVMCYGDSLQFSVVGGALNPNAHWVWYQEGCGGDGIFEALGESVWLSPLVTTTYYVRAESGSYYSYCNDFTLIVVDAPVAEIVASDTLLCHGDTLHLSAPSGDYYNYTWTGPNDFSSTDQFPSVDSVSVEHTGWYHLEIINAPDCWDTDSVWVEVIDFPAFEATLTDPGCEGATDGSIVLTFADSTGYEVEWIDMEFTGTNLSDIGAGLYTAFIQSPGYCSTTVSYELNAPPSPIDTVQVLPTTCGEDNGGIQVVLHEFAEGLIFDWEPDVSQSASASNLAPGEYEITVIDADECVYDLTATVPDSEGVSADWAQISPVSCPGESDGFLEVIATGGAQLYTFNWSTGDTATTLIDNLASGNYSVTVIDTVGCTESLTVQLQEPAVPEILAEITPEICQNGEGSIWLEADGGQPVEFLWLHNDATTPMLNELTAGEYAVQVIDSAGCISNHTYVVNGTGDVSVVIVPPDAAIDQGESVELSAQITPDSINVTYFWEPPHGLSCTDCPNPVGTPDSTIAYTVTVISDEGCEDTAEIRITVEPVCPDFFIPDIFSPNGDGHNDDWCIFGGCISQLEMQIFNRWGELMFESKAQDKCWDGEFRGSPVPSGAVVFTVRAVLESGEIISESGNLTIVR